MPREAERPRNRERDPDRERERRRERDTDRERRHRELDPERERRHRERDPDRERRRRERDPEREREREERRRERERRRSRNHDKDSRESQSRDEPPSSQSSSQPLSADSLAKLNQLNKKSEKDPERPRRKRHREAFNEKYEPIAVEKPRRHKKKKRRVVSGALLEEGEGKRLSYIRGGDYDNQDEESTAKKKKRIWIIVGVIILLLAIIIPVSIVLSNKNKGNTNAADTPSNGGKPDSNLDGASPDSVPIAAKGTELDPFSWLDTTDFNVTYTAQTVGGLPVIGLFSEWDDSTKANDKVPALDEAWGPYDTRPARGVNLGGWLSIEPFITPSLFSAYDSRLGIIDEWTLCDHLGPTPAKQTLEKHYSTFVTEKTFSEIKDAGLDHVRIPFSYWALQNFYGEPYVEKVAWRYLLRGIEWARKYGLRINLDVHGLPGSQNGWNHSGRQGDIGWLNGTDGDINAQRSLDIHRSLSTFFSQPRYKNIIAFYGLVNEPKMTALTPSDVQAWTASAYTIVRENGITCPIVFGDGFLGLENWKGKLQGHDGLVLDVHQYVIFNTGQIVFSHQEKVKYACDGWTGQAQQSMNVATGFGPTIFAEWSQADTDCATYLNNVGWGNRWEGTYDTGNPLTRVLSATCPTNNGGPTCTCDTANANPSTYSAEYKQFLQMFAEAQMDSFEHGWGWFYWTWQTETATQWSYKRGLAAGILPAKAYAPEFNCKMTIPSFGDLPENY